MSIFVKMPILPNSAPHLARRRISTLYKLHSPMSEFILRWNTLLSGVSSDAWQKRFEISLVCSFCGNG